MLRSHFSEVHFASSGVRPVAVHVDRGRRVLVYNVRKTMVKSAGDLMIEVACTHL